MNEGMVVSSLNGRELVAEPTLHSDVLRRILRCLDGTALANLSCVAKDFHAVSGEQCLWQRLVNSTWPETARPDVHQLIDSFPGGFRKFYSDAYPLVSPSVSLASISGSQLDPSELVSIVDLRYRGRIVFSKVLYGILALESVEGREEMAAWLNGSAFRLDALDAKDDLPEIDIAEGDCTGGEIRRLLEDGLRLDWIVLCSTRGRAVSLTSRIPIEVERRWYSDTEYVIKFGTVLPLDGELIHCAACVKCGSCAGGKMKVREVGMAMEDTEGVNLLGKDGLDILHRAIDCERRKCGEWLKGQYETFLRAKSETRRRKATRNKRVVGAWTLSAVSVFVAICIFMTTRR